MIALTLLLLLLSFDYSVPPTPILLLLVLISSSSSSTYFYLVINKTTIPLQLSIDNQHHLTRTKPTTHRFSYAICCSSVGAVQEDLSAPSALPLIRIPCALHTRRQPHTYLSVQPHPPCARIGSSLKSPTSQIGAGPKREGPAYCSSVFRT